MRESPRYQRLPSESARFSSMIGFSSLPRTLCFRAASLFYCALREVFVGKELLDWWADPFTVRGRQSAPTIGRLRKNQENIVKNFLSL
jgi:hypothetical protein